jgi:Txe/YoeB family toxin of Txe-Axe toxin-antitoxin module
MLETISSICSKISCEKTRGAGGKQNKAAKNKKPGLLFIHEVLSGGGLIKGIGKPEALKGTKTYSRRIDEKNRLIYAGDEDNNLRIFSCKGHYSDK